MQYGASTAQRNGERKQSRQTLSSQRPGHAARIRQSSLRANQLNIPLSPPAVDMKTMERRVAIAATDERSAEWLQAHPPSFNWS